MIRSTAHTSNPTVEADTAVLLDADLAILSAEERHYARYAADIRREYAWVDDARYQSGRTKVLQGFLNRSRIYRTDRMHAVAEEPARRNLQAELRHSTPRVCIHDCRRPTPALRHAPPTEKLITLVFALVGKDKADQVEFDNSLVKPAYECATAWTGSSANWFAAGSCLARDRAIFAAEFATDSAAIIELVPGRGRFPDFPAGGTLPVRYGDITCKFDILFFRGRTAQHIWVEKLDAVDVSQISAEFLRRHVRASPDGLSQL